MKCEESKPCTRCQTRSISCEYATAEAGSAAAMHLLHLSANPHLPSRPDTEPSSSHQSSTDSSPRSCRNENTGGPSPLSYPQGKAASSVVPRAPSATAEEAQLPTPETMDQTGVFALRPPGTLSSPAPMRRPEVGADPCRSHEWIPPVPKSLNR